CERASRRDRQPIARSGVIDAAPSSTGNPRLDEARDRHRYSLLAWGHLHAGPGLCDLPKKSNVHLGINSRCVDVAVAKHGTDGVERCTLTEQSRRKRVTKNMGAVGRSLDARALDQAPNNVA